MGGKQKRRRLPELSGSRRIRAEATPMKMELMLLTSHLAIVKRRTSLTSAKVSEKAENKKMVGKEIGGKLR